MRIGDNITFHPRPSFPLLPEADEQAIKSSHVPTRESSEICARIFRRLACYAEQQPGGFFLTGERGVGKTHLLRLVACLLKDPHDTFWAAWNSQVPGELRPRMALNSLFVSLPEDPDTDLGQFLAGELHSESPSRSHGAESGEARMPFEQFADLIGEAAVDHAASSLGMLVFDDVSRRLERVDRPEQLEEELSLLKLATEVYSKRGTLVFLVLDEKHLRLDGAAGIQTSLHDNLGDSCDFVWLSPNHVAEIVATSIAHKNDAQKVEIRGVLNRLRRKLPYLAAKPENIIDLYPLLPDVFYALFGLRSVLPDFSPLQFIQDAVQAVRPGPAEQLVTLDKLFDHVVDSLRQQEDCQPILESYDHVERDILPLVKPAAQAKALSLLKGITFLSICESQPPTVRTLANSLLIYDENDFLQSYSLTSAILMDLEQKGGRYFEADGEKLDRQYRLLRFGETLNFPTAKQILAQDDEFPIRFPLLLYDWVHNEIPAWNPDTSSRYVRTSQSLIAPAPIDESGPKGLVYFKSIFDPLWSSEDLMSLDESTFPWVVLIVSPYERFYEYEQSLRELGGHLSRLLIWHPDIPTADETEQLRKLATIRSARKVSAKLRRPDEDEWVKVKTEAYMILNDLYVRRGRFITSSIEWCVGEEIKNQSLGHHISEHLSILAQAFEAGYFLKTGTGEKTSGTGETTQRSLLRWAWMLSNLDSIQSVSLEEAEKLFLDWWSRLEMSGMLTGLDAIPDCLMNVQFWDHLKSYQSGLEDLRPTMIRLRDGEIVLTEALALIARTFNNDAERLKSWKDSLDNLAGLMRWLPSLEHSRDYLYSVVPSGLADLENLRKELLGALDNPHHFIEAIHRDNFDQKFLQFKKGYIEYYCTAHDEATHVAGIPKKTKSKVDYVALRNLELLSHLEHTDRVHLQRVRIIGNWVQSHQCELPVWEILESSARCYCNFGPAASDHVREAVERMSAAVQEGIQYFRALLRHCKTHIIRDLKSMKPAENYARQIASLLSQGRVLPLDPGSVEILNQILQKHSRTFIAAVRAYRVSSSR